MTYRQSETYNRAKYLKTYHYSLFHPRGRFPLDGEGEDFPWMKQAVVVRGNVHIHVATQNVILTF